MNNTIAGIVGGFCFVLAMGFVGSGDYEEAKRKEADYCKRVALFEDGQDGGHSNYRNLDCGTDVQKAN